MLWWWYCHDVTLKMICCIEAVTLKLLRPSLAWVQDIHDSVQSNSTRRSGLLELILNCTWVPVALCQEAMLLRVKTCDQLNRPKWGSRKEVQGLLAYEVEKTQFGTTHAPYQNDRQQKYTNIETQLSYCWSRQKLPRRPHFLFQIQLVLQCCRWNIETCQNLRS